MYIAALPVILQIYGATATTIPERRGKIGNQLVGNTVLYKSNKRVL
jgi:hypothetical protein